MRKAEKDKKLSVCDIRLIIKKGGSEMKKTLVAYFSCTGNTKRVAKALAEAINADLFEITPQTRYTNADLDWTNEKSRCNLEMKDPSSRPAIKEKAENMESYKTVFIGFPIWWYVAPHIIKTFLESYDFTGKTIVPFATSGGSGMGRTVEELQKSCFSSVKWDKGKIWNGNPSEEALASWAKDFI